MKREILIFVGIFMCANMLFAQDEIRDAQEAQKEINAIKQDNSYLYAAATSITTAEEASDNAKDLLMLEIEEWLKEKNTNNIAGYVAKSCENLSQITTKRGKLYRAFVFLKKDEILTYGQKEDVMIVELSKEKRTETKHQQDSTVVVTKGVTNVSTSKVDIPQPAQESTNVLTQREKELLNLKSFDNINKYISQGKKDGKIAQTGKYATMPKKGIVYLLIYNKKGEISAYMKVTDAKSVNICTGKEDPIKNYKGCGAIWIKGCSIN